MRGIPLLMHQSLNIGLEDGAVFLFARMAVAVAAARIAVAAAIVINFFISLNGFNSVDLLCGRKAHHLEENLSASTFWYNFIIL